jgi:hypothetical protein
MPDGQTVATHIKPRIAAAYEQGSMVALLPPPHRYRLLVLTHQRCSVDTNTLRLKQEAKLASTGRTHYSEKIKGDRGNHNFESRFDVSDGYLGITQWDGESVTDRVLLSPAQVQGLLDFVGKKITSRAA